MVTVVKSQPENAITPILVTVSGISISLSLVPEKAKLPIIFVFLPSFTLSRASHSLNKSWLITVTLSGNSMLFRDLHSLNEASPMSVRFFGCQFVIATHSPFILGLKDAKIYDLDSDPARVRKWTELPAVRAYYDFFKERAREFEQDRP